jgi:pilus assembly protein CpaB
LKGAGDLLNSGRKLLLLAVIMGLITVLALNQYLKTPAAASMLPPVPKTDVVVASITIPQHSRITAEMLTIASVPEDAIHPEALMSLDEAIGGISRADIIKGEQVLKSRVATDTRRAGLSYRVPEKLRGISIPVSEVSGVSGYISAGDKVDVLVAYDDPDIKEIPIVYTVVQNATVLAVGEYPLPQDNEERRLVNSVTLLVTPAQAEVLAFANVNGSFHLSLRSPLDEEIVGLDYYSPENLNSFRER